MSDHTEIRLKKNGTVVAYLAPNFEVNPVDDNSLVPGGGEALPGDRPTRVRDQQLIRSQITVQGSFEPTHDPDTGTPNLPQAHIDDLQSLFDKQLVTARDQVNRIRSYLHTVGGPFELYEGEDEYTATTGSDVDWEEGTFPVVQISQFRPPSMGGHRNFEYMIEFVVGTERS